MQVVRLFDEVVLMSELQEETIALIHATSIMNPIKKLVDAYEIISLNLTIEKRFKDYDDPPWDIPALSDLSCIRRELVVYHRSDFHPTRLIDKYSTKLIKLFRHIHTRKKLTSTILGIEPR